MSDGVLLLILTLTLFGIGVLRACASSPTWEQTSRPAGHPPPGRKSPRGVGVGRPFLPLRYCVPLLALFCVAGLAYGGHWWYQTLGRIHETHTVDAYRFTITSTRDPEWADYGESGEDIAITIYQGDKLIAKRLHIGSIADSTTPPTFTARRIPNGRSSSSPATTARRQSCSPTTRQRENRVRGAKASRIRSTTSDASTSELVSAPLSATLATTSATSTISESALPVVTRTTSPAGSRDLLHALVRAVRPAVVDERRPVARRRTQPLRPEDRRGVEHRVPLRPGVDRRLVVALRLAAGPRLARRDHLQPGDLRRVAVELPADQARDRVALLHARCPRRSSGPASCRPSRPSR